MPYSTEPAASELSLDLTTQELLALPTFAGMVEIDDIRTIDPTLGAHGAAANADRARIEEIGGSVEIELSAEQILALLEGAR